MSGPRCLHAFDSGLNSNCFDPIVQGEMLDERLAHVSVIVDNQNLPDNCHRIWILEGVAASLGGMVAI